MQKTTTQFQEIYLVGITIRTNNVSEMNQETAKIGATVGHYFQQNIAERIPHRKAPKRIFCAYTEYENQHLGDFTFFIGEEVEKIENVPEGYQAHTIPAQTYTKFTTEAGEMPTVCISAWKQIWQMTPEELNGSRNYQTDFEIYDERAADPHSTILDIYIGVSQ